jgi:hypothetical protein
MEARDGEAKNWDVSEGGSSQRHHEANIANQDGDENGEVQGDEDDEHKDLVVDGDAIVLLLHRDDELERHCYYRQQE